MDFGYILIVCLLIIILVIITTYALYYYQKEYSCNTIPSIRCYNDWTCPESPECTGNTSGPQFPYCWAGTEAIYFNVGATGITGIPGVNDNPPLCNFPPPTTSNVNPVVDGYCSCAWANVNNGTYPLSKFCNPPANSAPHVT